LHSRTHLFGRILLCSSSHCRSLSFGGSCSSCFVVLHFPLISSLILSLLPSSSPCQTELLILAGSASAPATPSTPRAASFSPRLKNRRVRLLHSLFESSALCVMLTHLCEDLSVLVCVGCSPVHFAVPSASACVAPSSSVRICSHLTCQDCSQVRIRLRSQDRSQSSSQPPSQPSISSQPPSQPSSSKQLFLQPSSMFAAKSTEQDSSRGCRDLCREHCLWNIIQDHATMLPLLLYHCISCSQRSRCFSTPPSLYRINQSAILE
jgi:hypothetical protein